MIYDQLGAKGVEGLLKTDLMRFLGYKINVFLDSIGLGRIGTFFGENMGILLFAIIIFLASFFANKNEKLREKAGGGMYFVIGMIASVFVIITTFLQNLVPSFIELINAVGQLFISIYVIFLGSSLLGNGIANSAGALMASLTGQSKSNNPQSGANVGIMSIASLLKAVMGLILIIPSFFYLFSSLSVLKEIPGLQFLGVVQGVAGWGAGIILFILALAITAFILSKIHMAKSRILAIIVSIFLTGLFLVIDYFIFRFKGASAGLSILFIAVIISFLVYRLAKGEKIKQDLHSSKIQWSVGILVVLIAGGAWFWFFKVDTLSVGYYTALWIGVAVLIGLWIWYRLTNK
jgi:hypothetical protein